MLTSGTLSALQEVLASWIAHDRSKHGHYISSRVPKMAVYGAFISAPLGHVLITLLQKVFAGRTSLKAKILQILVSNLIVRIHLGAVFTAELRANFRSLKRYLQSKTLSILSRWLSLQARELIIRSELPSRQASCLS